MRITLVEDVEALAPRAMEWNDLVARSTTNTVFQTFEWTRSWWRTLSGDARPLVLLAERAGRLVGVAPLMSTTQRILGRRRRVVEFIGTDAADYADFIVDAAVPDTARRLLGWLEERRERWDLLQLVNIADTSLLLEAMPRIFGTGYVTDVHRLYECPSRLLGDAAADRKAVQKKSMRLRFNQLSRQGEITFETHAAAAEIDARLERFFDQHVERWAATPTPSFFLDERQRRFYRELTASLAPRGWVFFCAMLVGGRPVAHHFGFHYAGRIFYIKPAYDPRYREFGPGVLQIRYVLEHAARVGAREVDFTAGEEPFKYQFANQARVSHFARVHRPGIFYGMDRVLVHAKVLAQKTPLVRQVGQRLRPMLGGTLRRLGL